MAALEKAICALRARNAERGDKSVQDRNLLKGPSGYLPISLCFATFIFPAQYSLDLYCLVLFHLCISDFKSEVQHPRRGVALQIPCSPSQSRRGSPLARRGGQTLLNLFRGQSPGRAGRWPPGRRTGSWAWPSRTLILQIWRRRQASLLSIRIMLVIR